MTLEEGMGFTRWSVHVQSHDVELQILGQVDRRHPTGADLPLDRVAVPKESSQSFKGIGHRSLRCHLRYERASGAADIRGLRAEARGYPPPPRYAAIWYEVATK